MLKNIIFTNRQVLFFCFGWEVVSFIFFPPNTLCIGLGLWYPRGLSTDHAVQKNFHPWGKVLNEVPVPLPSPAEVPWYLGIWLLSSPEMSRNKACQALWWLWGALLGPAAPGGSVLAALLPASLISASLSPLICIYTRVSSAMEVQSLCICLYGVCAKCYICLWGL